MIEPSKFKHIKVVIDGSVQRYSVESLYDGEGYFVFRSITQAGKKTKSESYTVASYSGESIVRVKTLDVAKRIADETPVDIY